MTSGCDQVDRGYSMEARPFPDRRFSERSHLALSGVLSTLCPLEHVADPLRVERKGAEGAKDSLKERGLVPAFRSGRRNPTVADVDNPRAKFTRFIAAVCDVDEGKSQFTLQPQNF